MVILQKDSQTQLQFITANGYKAVRGKDESDGDATRYRLPESPPDGGHSGHAECPTQEREACPTLRSTAFIRAGHMGTCHHVTRRRY